MLGIYVHIPFCASKCIYCDFASGVGTNEQQKRYMERVLREIDTCPLAGEAVESIYLGGGTPSVVESPLIALLLQRLRTQFRWTSDIEISMECNPCSVTRKKLSDYRDAGVNRLSIGVQSLSAGQLQFLGRKHSPKQALEALGMAREVGIENLSADLLIGLPAQTQEQLCADAAAVIDAGATHVSAYMLQIEQGTPLAALAAANKGLLPSDDTCVALYDALATYLARRGYARYEVSNFAREGFRCRHNEKYWALEPYVGFGLAAHSFYNGQRRANSKDFASYDAGIVETEQLTPAQQVEELLMLGLRCHLGVELQRLASLGYDIRASIPYQSFLQRGILSQVQGRFFLSPQYYGVSNYIIVSLLPT